MNIIAIDPGSKSSAWVQMDGARINSCDICENAELRRILRRFDDYECLVIEKIRSYGKPVGEDVFETVFWTGRFFECFDGRCERITRMAVTMYLTGNPKSNDKDIRNSIIRCYGGEEAAIGCSEFPGPLFSIVTHLWAALGVGLTFQRIGQAEIDAAGFTPGKLSRRSKKGVSSNACLNETVQGDYSFQGASERKGNDDRGNGG